MFCCLAITSGHGTNWHCFIIAVHSLLLSLENDRRTVFIALTVISLVGTVLFFLIRKPDPENVLGEEESCDDQDMEAPE